MAVAGMTTGDISVEAFNLMREANRLKEVQRAIDGWWFGCAFAIKVGEQIIGLCWFFTIKKEFQDLATDTGQALAFGFCYGFSLRQKSISICGAAGRVRQMAVDVLGHDLLFLTLLNRLASVSVQAVFR